jgi:hypothetical protein
MSQCVDAVDLVYWVIKLLAFVASVEFIVSIESRTSSKLKGESKRNLVS